MENKPNQTEEKKELDRYERIVDRAHKEIKGVRYVYIWLASIMGIILATAIACGTFLTYNTINDMKSDLDQRTEKLANEVKARIDEEFKTEKITELIVNQAGIRVDAVVDELIGKHVENKIDPKIKAIDVKLKTLNDKTETLKDEFTTVIKGQTRLVDKFSSDQDKKIRKRDARITKQQELINELSTVANTNTENLREMIRLAKAPELILSSQPIIQKIKEGYGVELKFIQPEGKSLGRIGFEVQVVDASEAKILDLSRTGATISIGLVTGIDKNGKKASLQYSSLGSRLQQIKIQVSGKCKLSILSNYLAKPLSIVVE